MEMAYIYGGTDMRIWASVPSFVILSTVFALNANNNYVFYFLSMFCICWSLIIAIIHPYKEKLTVITDTFIFANTSILSDQNITQHGKREVNML